MFNEALVTCQHYVKNFISGTSLKFSPQPSEIGAVMLIFADGKPKPRGNCGKDHVSHVQPTKSSWKTKPGFYLGCSLLSSSERRRLGRRVPQLNSSFHKGFTAWLYVVYLSFFFFLILTDPLKVNASGVRNTIYCLRAERFC